MLLYALCTEIEISCRFKCIQWVDEPMSSCDAALTHQPVQPSTCTADDLSWLVAADCKSADGSTNPCAITKRETLIAQDGLFDAVLDRSETGEMRPGNADGLHYYWE
jgi:hypothetical protein